MLTPAANIVALDEATEMLAPGASIVKSLRADQDGLWQPAEPAIRVALRALGQHLAAVTASQGGLVLETTPKQRIAAIIAAANLPGWIESQFGPIYELLYKRTAQKTMATLTNRGFPVTERQRIEARVLNEYGKRLGLVDLRKQTKESLFRILNVAREEGLSPRAAAYMIEDLVPKGRFINAGSRYRAELIARSEMLHAQRISSIESYKRSKVVKEVVAFDGDGDSRCLARNGQHMSFGQAEVEAANTHPQCVLTFGPVT